MSDTPDPELVRRLAEELAAIYADTETRLLALIANRLARGMDIPTWVQDKLDQVQEVRRQAQRILDQARQAAQQAADQAAAEAAAVGAAAALQQLAALGMSTGQLAGNAAISMLVNEAVTGIVAGQVRVLRDVIDNYRTITTRAATGVLTGAQTRRDATQTALNRLAADGLTGFVDRSGRRWRLESYAEMTMRTITRHAMVQAQLDTLARAGLDLVYVSDSPRECPRCRPWEHQVLSITGASGGVQARNPLTGRMETVTVRAGVSEAVMAGLFHPNCTHTVSAYLPGVTRLPEPTSAPESYEAKQLQRYLERQVRAWKRRQAVAITPQASQRARQRIRAYQARIRALLAEHPELKRLPYREQPMRPTGPG